MLKSRRVMAWCVDFALVVTLAVLLGWFTVHRVSALLTDVPDLATRGGWEFLRSKGEALDVAEGMGLSLWGKAVGYVEQAFGALVLLTFLYQWASISLTGRTLGKALVGLRITPVAAHRAALRAVTTTVADVALYALACCLLVEGEFFLSALCWAASVVVFLLNAVPVLAPSCRSLADRLTGTAVESVRLPVPAAPLPPAPGDVPAW
ncbi:RDD family protein [Streptomyces sp. NPDC087866]|uniref:RDD family protein n=1 Tax=unclassified Streptomyces TaxID=2593676 RepID=UPI001CD0A045|nr:MULTISPECIES: RDD family protein [unclassified Streptomyces]MCX4447147.1 RDD family protein [Streptomyces sp. NBC_01789]